MISWICISGLVSFWAHCIWRIGSSMAFSRRRLRALEVASQLGTQYKAHLAAVAALASVARGKPELQRLLVRAQRDADAVALQLTAQRGLCASMRRPTKRDRLAWATDQELQRELRRRARWRAFHRMCDRVVGG